MANELIIRPARIDDLPTLVDFNARMAWETESKKLELDVLTNGCRAVLTTSDKGFYTVAEQEGVVVGQCLMTMEWSDWRNGWFWWVQSVYVAESARRTGVWSAIYQHLLTRAAADESIIGIRLYVERGNDRARSAYLKIGMHDAGYDIMEHHPLPGRAALYGQK
jgi:GNAT superfamily N-acetyltransferase